MTVAKFVQPNSLTATDATIYKGELDAAIAVLAVVGTQFAPHATDTPSMSILLDAGALLAGGSRNVQAQQAAGPFTAASGGMQRVDRVVIDARTGVYAIVAGIEVAAAPVAPAIPPGKLPVASVGPITSATMAITDAMISDERVALASAAADVQKQAYTRAQAGGTADAMTGSLAPAPAAYVAGLRWTTTPPGANTSTAPTWNLNALGAKTIKKRDAGGALVALAAGDYNASGPFDFQVADDVSAVVLLNPLASSGARTGAASVTLSSGTPNVTLTASSGQVQVIASDTGGRSMTMPAMNTLTKQADYFKLKSVTENPVFIRDSGGVVRDVIKSGTYGVDVIDNSGANTWFDVNSGVCAGPIDTARTAVTLATTIIEVCEVVRFGDDSFIVFYTKPNGSNIDFCARLVAVNTATAVVTVGAECVYLSNANSSHGYQCGSGGDGTKALATVRYSSWGGGGALYGYGFTASGTTLTATAQFSFGIGATYFAIGNCDIVHVGQNNWVVFVGWGAYGSTAYAQAFLVYFNGSALVKHGTTMGTSAGTGGNPSEMSCHFMRLTATALSCYFAARSQTGETSYTYRIIDVTPGTTPTWTDAARTGTYASSKMPGEYTWNNAHGVGYYPSTINAVGLTITPNGNVYQVTGSGTTRATSSVLLSAKLYPAPSYGAHATGAFANLATFFKDGSTSRLLRSNGSGGYIVHEFDDTATALNINYNNQAILSAYQTAGQLANKPFIQRPFQMTNTKAAVFYNTATDQLVVDVHQLTTPFRQ